MIELGLYYVNRREGLTNITREFLAQKGLHDYDRIRSCSLLVIDGEFYSIGSSDSYRIYVYKLKEEVRKDAQIGDNLEGNGEQTS